MSQFYYRNKSLVFASQDLGELAKKFGTPLYVYDLDGIKKRAQSLKSHLPNNCLIHYAMKANSNLQILKLFRQLNIGVDVVSGGEMNLAFRAGFKPDQVVFSGVGKSAEEIQLAIRKNIRSINVESLAELHRILKLAQSLRKVARISLRLNPNVNARTHKHITTGKDYNKFGLSKLELKECLPILRCNKHHLQLVGLTFHLGSQIQSLAPYKIAVKRVKGLLQELIEDGHPLEHLSVGGGLGIRYFKEKPMDIRAFGNFMKKTFKNLPVRPMCEPGRILVGEFGVLLTKVQYVKKTGRNNFAIVDTGMHHLMRPALYNAYHEIIPLKKKDKGVEVFEIVGPICESTDVLGRDRKFSALTSDDYLAILNSGAYGYVMANFYNCHKLPREVLVHKNRVNSSGR